MLEVAQTGGQTSANGGITNAPLQPLRTVTYLIRTFATNVNLPYAVEVGGVVGTAFTNGPKSVLCLGSGADGPPPPFTYEGQAIQKIKVTGVAPGTVVRLYLNSDAHPSYRKFPVYAVTPTTRNVQVVICERKQLAIQNDELVPMPDLSTATVERYNGYLTGNTWMKFSHKYLTEEVEPLIPATTLPVVAAAVRSIYAGLSANSIVLNLPGPPPRTINITLQPSSECTDNIATGYDFRREGLTRVHPAAYIALFKAIIDCGLNNMRVTSGWRPMLGSIVHRAGLGLDVDYLGTVVLNRAHLISPGGNTQNVTEAEKTLYEAWLANKTPANHAAWKAVLDQNEPEVVKAFRKSLDENDLVKQIFDPWYMDANTSPTDTVPGKPNTVIDGNEKLHKNHLHVTIAEPKILGTPQTS